MRILRKALIYLFVFFLALFVAAWVLAGIYKKEIVAEITRTLSDNINGTVKIEDADLVFWSTFPHLSIRLEKVHVSNIQHEQVPFFNANKLYVLVKLLPLLTGTISFQSIRIEDATAFIYRSRSGVLNLNDLKKKDTVAHSDSNMSLLDLSNGEIVFDNTHIAYHDSLKGKFMGFQLHEASLLSGQHDTLFHHRLKGRVFFDSLTFNAARGSFLKNTMGTLDVRIISNALSKEIFIDSSLLQLTKSTVFLSGRANLSDSGRLHLMIKSASLNYQEGLQVIPRSLANTLRVISIDEPFAYEVRIETPLREATEPYLQMQFELNNNAVHSNKLKISNVSVRGTFTNWHDKELPRGNVNSSVHLSNLTGTMDGLPFSAEAWLTDLQALNLRLHSEHQFDLQLLNRLSDTTRLKILGGTFASSFQYEGNLHEYLDTTATTLTGKLKGQAVVKNASVNWIPRKLMFSNVNTSLHFNQDTVWVDAVSVTSGSNQLYASGLIGNYVPFFVQPSHKGFVTLNVHSPALDLTSLLVKKEKKKSTAAQKARERKKISDLVDKLLTNLEFQLALDVGALKNRSFAATKLKGVVQVGKNQVNAKNLRMNFAQGTIEASVRISDLNRDINPVFLTARINGVEVSDLFKAFNDFRQEKITHKNLDGRVSVSAQLSARIDDDFDFLPASFSGPVSFKIVNGQLIELPALATLSNFLLKRRDFEHVKFAEINGELNVEAREITVERMEVQSNVLGIFVEGVYSLGTKTDLSIQIPLSNLKKRDQSFAPEKIGTHAKAGVSVFLRAHANDKGETVISYDPLYRFKKKNK